MAKIRVHELAKEIGKSSKELTDFLNAKGYDFITAVNIVPESEVAVIRAKFGAAAPVKESGSQAPAGKETPAPAAEKPKETEKKPEKEEAPRKKGTYHVYRKQNATGQLQRRPRRAPGTPERRPVQAEAPLVGELVPEEKPETAAADIPSLVTGAELSAKPEGRKAETPAAAAEEASSPAAGAPAAAGGSSEKAASPAPVDTSASPTEETPARGEAAPVKEPKETSSEEKTDGRRQRTAPAAADKGESGGKAAAPAAEEKKDDGGFRNGRILRNVGSLNPRIPTPAGAGTAQRGRTGTGRGTGMGRSAGDRDRRTGGPGRGSDMRERAYGTGQAGDRSRAGYGRTDRTPAGGAGRYGAQGTGAPGRGYAGAGQGRPGAGGPAAAGRGRSAAPGAGKGAADGSLAKKTSRDFRKDGKEREKSREERRELGHHAEAGSRTGGQKRQFNRIPKALQHKQPAAPQEKKEEVVTEIRIPERITVRDLAEKMKIAPAMIVKELFMKGEMVTVNHELPFEKAEAIAMDHDIICEQEEKEDVIGHLLEESAEDESSMVSRPPVVCVMGHVDHGKTSLLDAIRNTHVTDREAGGITQHIGAYMVSVNGQKITFLDTPGHEAFTAMRMRGANATDIAVLVVAADDGVMPQTVEAINHAKAAGTEIIVAVNKIDKPGANVDRVKQELSEYGLIAEDWGGSTVFCPVSAKTQEGLDNLLEMILLTADMRELKANPDRKARGIVLEAKLDKGRGPVASILIQKGTLHQGDFIACGAASGKVRAMTDEKGKRLHKATPSMPVEIIGLSAVPEAGEVLVAMESDKEAKDFAAVFVSEGKKNLIEETRTQMSLDDLFNQIKEGSLKELPIVVKADVQGSVEAVSQSLLKLSNDEVVVKVIHGGVGAINESDVSLAAASNAIVIGFNVRPDATAKVMADSQKVDIHLYNVIYEAIEDVERALNGMKAAVFEEKVLGHAEIRMMFKASGIGNIAGGYIKDGTFTRNSKVRVFRGEEKIYEGELASLKRFKDDVKEVREGFECGFVFKDWGDFQVEDTVEAYTMVEVPRT